MWTINYLIHYNHNHDRLGRFTSGPGGVANDSTVLPKGYKLNSVRGYNSNELDYYGNFSAKGRANMYRKTGRPLYAFNPEDKWDSSVYRGPFAKYLVMYRGKIFLEEYQYKTTKDLKMPTREERLKEFKDLYNDKKYNEKVVKELSNIQGKLIEAKVGSPKEQKSWGSVDVKNMKSASDKDWEIAYKIFNHAMEAQHSGKSTSEYVKRMSKKYDAMVDDNNQKYYNGVHDPIIIFKANKVLETVSTEKLTPKEVVDNYEYARKELEKLGHLPKL